MFKQLGVYLARSVIAELRAENLRLNEALRYESERRHEAELKVAASRYGETFSSKRYFKEVIDIPAGPWLDKKQHARKLLG